MFRMGSEMICVELTMDATPKEWKLLKYTIRPHVSIYRCREATVHRFQTLKENQIFRKKTQNGVKSYTHLFLWFIGSLT